MSIPCEGCHPIILEECVIWQLCNQSNSDTVYARRAPRSGYKGITTPGLISEEPIGKAGTGQPYKSFTGGRWEKRHPTDIST